MEGNGGVTAFVGNSRPPIQKATLAERLMGLGSPDTSAERSAMTHHRSSQPDSSIFQVHHLLTQCCKPGTQPCIPGASIESELNMYAGEIS
jgi:hypothetical protein